MVELCSAIPDGIVAFFTSYSYMESIISEWDSMGIMRQLTKSKLVFIETKDVVETTMALDNFRRACDSGRGAVFLSVARGKVRLSFICWSYSRQLTADRLHYFHLANIWWCTKLSFLLPTLKGL
jgi:hypothetical protein